MASNEYWEGRNFEKNNVLKETVAKLFNFDSMDSDGSTDTKGDLIGIKGEERTHISVKFASISNTQVHLPTLKSFASQLAMPDSVYEKLDKFFGTNDLEQWATWSTGLNLDAEELKYRRIKSKNIKDWHEVEQWFNDNKRKIAVLLLQTLDGNNPAPYLVWANKKKGGMQVIDLNKFVDYIEKHCTWITMPRGTVLRCAKPSEVEGKIGKPIFYVQMKNSGGPPGGYNHYPQFHLHNYWPDDLVIYKDLTLKYEL